MRQRWWEAKSVGLLFRALESLPIAVSPFRAGVLGSPLHATRHDQALRADSGGYHIARVEGLPLERLEAKHFRWNSELRQGGSRLLHRPGLGTLHKAPDGISRQGGIG